MRGVFAVLTGGGGAIEGFLEIDEHHSSLEVLGFDSLLTPYDPP
jgi:hypothetical protein